MLISSLLSSIRKHFLRYQPVVEIFVHKNNILNNYNIFKNEYPKKAIAPVLKSNAYGHGLVEIAKIISTEKPPFIVIDSIFEALRLRRAGIETPLLVIGYTNPQNIVISKLKNTDFGITALETLEYISQNLKKPINVHLKFDTGMHRQGLNPTDLTAAQNLVNKNKNIIVTGIFSHLADPDNTDSTFTMKQINTWNALSKNCRAIFPNAKYYHLAASYGAAFSNHIDANMIRLGISLYGYNNSPHQSKLPLKPALEMKTTVTSLRTIPAGESVGYNCTFTASAPTKVATIPVGYFEGFDRRLSNIGSAQINKIFAPFVGRVSMNIISLNVTSDPQTKVGDGVTVLGLNSSDPNSINAISKLIGTIPYEFLVHIPPHLRRTVI